MSSVVRSNQRKRKMLSWIVLLLGLGTAIIFVYIAIAAGMLSGAPTEARRALLDQASFWVIAALISTAVAIAGFAWLRWNS